MLEFEPLHFLLLKNVDQSLVSAGFGSTHVYAALYVYPPHHAYIAHRMDCTIYTVHAYTTPCDVYDTIHHAMYAWRDGVYTHVHIHVYEQSTRMLLDMTLGHGCSRLCRAMTRGAASCNGML